MTFAVEELLGVLTRECKVLWHSSEEFHHLGKMIIILVVVLSLSRLKQKVSGNHLEDSTCEGPDICRGVVVSSNNNLG